jgi:hypothetical protein
MKKTLAIAALAVITATAGFAGTASASPFVPDNINAREAQINQRIDMGARSGRLTVSEVRDLRGQMRTVANVEARYRRGGLNRMERVDLDRRLDRVQLNLQHQLNDRDHRR